MKTNRLSSVALITMILLSLAMTSGIRPTTAATTFVSVINPATGDGNFKYNTTSPPPGGVFTVNITVTDVVNLQGWQVNLTFDKTLLSIAAAADLYVPPDHIFNGFDPTFQAKDINNTLGYVLWACAVGPASPYVSFNGSGRLMCVKFTVIKIPTSGNPFLSCHLVLDRVSIFPTGLIDPDPNDIPFTEQNGYYEYSYIKPPPTKPWLEVSPALKVLGEPPGPSIVGTPKAFFTVDILIKNVTSEMDLIAVELIGGADPIWYNNTVLRLYNPEDPWSNITEGTFMNNPLWAPYGTIFFWVEDTDTPTGMNRISIGCFIMPNETTNEYDWPERPFGEGLFCTLHFEVIKQEAFPWEQTTTLDLESWFPGEMFLNTTDGWIPYIGPYDGEIKIKGYNPLVGDINGDFKVDIKDLVLVIKHFGSYPSHPTKPWNPNADINCDNKVDIKDLVLVIKHFGEHYP